MYYNFLLLQLFNRRWKNIIHQERKYLKIYERIQRLKLWAQVAIAANSCPASAQMYGQSLGN